jgi:hypothetical protein
MPRGGAGALQEVVAEQHAAGRLDDLVERQVGERVGVDVGEQRDGLQGSAGWAVVAALARLLTGRIARKCAPVLPSANRDLSASR